MPAQGANLIRVAIDQVDFAIGEIGHGNGAVDQTVFRPDRKCASGSLSFVFAVIGTGAGRCVSKAPARAGLSHKPSWESEWTTTRCSHPA